MCCRIYQLKKQKTKHSVFQGNDVSAPLCGLSICNDKRLCKAKRSTIIEDVPFVRGKGGGGYSNEPYNGNRNLVWRLSEMKKK